MCSQDLHYVVNLSKLSSDDLSKSVSEYLSNCSSRFYIDYTNYIGKYVCVSLLEYKIIGKLLGYDNGLLSVDGYCIGYGYVERTLAGGRRIDVVLINGIELLSDDLYISYSDIISGFISECFELRKCLDSVLVSGKNERIEFKRGVTRPDANSYFNIDLYSVSGDSCLSDLYDSMLVGFREAIKFYEEIISYNKGFVGDYFLRDGNLYHCLGVSDYDGYPYGNIFSLSSDSLYRETDIRFMSSMSYIRLDSSYWYSCEGLCSRIEEFYKKLC